MAFSFRSHADDSQICVPLKKTDSYSVNPLLKCLDDIKAWTASNFLNFNEKKPPPPVDLGPLAQYLKPTVKNLGVKVDADLNFGSQITAVVKSSFFQLAAGKNETSPSEMAL